MTEPRFVDSILADGLLTGREPVLTCDAIWTVPLYGENPVFLSEPGSPFVTAMREAVWDDHAVFDVDVSGLPLVADLACLVDAGARYDPDGYLYWTPSRMPEAMRGFCDHDGAIEIEFLLDPDTDACRAAIRLTGTAASMSSIGPDRLTLQGPRQSPSP